MSNYAQRAEECPEHKGESLEIKNILIKYPSNPEGTITPMNYCPKSNKYLSKGKLVPVKEAALESFIFRNKSNLKIEDITVEEDLSKLIQKATA